MEPSHSNETRPARAGIEKKEEGEEEVKRGEEDTWGQKRLQNKKMSLKHVARMDPMQNANYFSRSLSIPAGLRWHTSPYASYYTQLNLEPQPIDPNALSRWIGLSELSESFHDVLKLNREYFESLLGSGEGTLINLIIHYHETLVRNGLKSEADGIIKEFQGYLKTLEQYKLLLSPELKGMNLLLKDGFLNFLLTMRPYFPKIPTQVVRFKNVNYEIDIEVSKNRIRNFMTAGWTMLKSMIFKPKRKKFKVLNEVTGYMMPGSMTLVFGPSGCGKSSLQRILSGHAKATGGEISYNGLPQCEVNLRRIAGVGFESNLHHYMLQIYEILSYARDFSNLFTIEESKKIEGLSNIFSQAVTQGEDPILESRLRLLGLKGAENSRAGFLSPDEQVRLTFAEIMVGAYSLLFFDHINPEYSRKSTYEIIDMIRIFSRVRQLSVIISLRLPTQEIFELFDRVILLNRGKVVYQGPTKDAVFYFESIGYKKPPFFSVAEFLQEVTTEKGKKFLMDGFDILDVEGFVSKYKSSSHYKDVLRIVDDPNYKHEYWVDSDLPLKDFRLKKIPPNENCSKEMDIKLNNEFSSYSEVESLNPQKSNQSSGVESHVNENLPHGNVETPFKVGKGKNEIVIPVNEMDSKDISGRTSVYHVHGQENDEESNIISIADKNQNESRQTLMSTSIVKTGDIVTGIAFPNKEMLYLKNFGGNLSSDSVFAYMENSGITQKCGTMLVEDMITSENNQPDKNQNVGNNSVKIEKLENIKEGEESEETKNSNGTNKDKVEEDKDEIENETRVQLNEDRIRLQMERTRQPVIEGIYKKQFESEYVLDFKTEFRTLFRRQNQIMFRNKFLLYARLIQVVVMSLFNATNLIQMSKKYIIMDMNLRRAVGFTSLVTMMLSNLGQLPFFLEEKAIYYKHAKARFFRPLTFLLAHFLSGLPYSLAEGTIWSVLIYFITGLSLDNGGYHFFVFLLVHLLLIVNGASMVRFIAFSAPDPQFANLVASVSMPVFLLFAHFLISIDHIPVYWKWIYYINPMQWCSNMIMTNEFKSSTYQRPCSENSQLKFCSSYPNDSVGVAYLKIYDWNYHDYIFYVGPIVVLTWIFLWNFFTFWCLRPNYFSRLSVGQKKYNLGPLIYKIDDYGALDETIERKEEDDMEKVESVMNLENFQGMKTDKSTSTNIISEMGVKNESLKNLTDNDGDLHSFSKDVEQGILKHDSKEIRKHNSDTILVDGNYDNDDDVQKTNSLPDLHSYTNEVLEKDKITKSCHNCIFPCRPVVLAWQSLSCEINRQGNISGRLVLSEISGWANPGEVFAILGANNSGKTTLLNCLAGKKVPGKINGQILVNGHVRDPATWIHVVGYVEKVELYPPYLTLKENLAYRATMNLPAEISKIQRMRMVEEVMECVKIGHLANYLVGEVSQSLELEKVKRIGIALELSANPSVLFLDSPLEGLDVKQAKDLANCLKNVGTLMQKTVILTSTFPSASCLSSFSSVMFLKRGGEMIYFGPAGKFGSDIISYFCSIPGTPSPSSNTTPVTYVYNLVGDGIHGRGTAIRDYAFEYRVSDLALRNAYHLASIRSQQLNNQSIPDIPIRITAPYHRKAKEVFINLQKLYWRNTNYTFNRLLYAVIMSTILGSLYYRVDPTKFLGMSTRTAFIFATVVFGGTVNASTAVSVIAQFKSVLAHEKEVRQFPPLLHVVSYTIAEIPYMAFSTLIFVSISASMANVAVNSAYNFFIFWITFFLTSLAITYIGLLLAIVVPRPQIASVVVPMLIGAWITTGGYIFPRSKIKSIYLWMFWTNPLQYALNTMTCVAFYCDTKSEYCGIPGCDTNPSLCPKCDCPRLLDYGNSFVWDTLKAQRSLERFRIGYDILFLASFCLLCRLLHYITRRITM